MSESSLTPQQQMAVQYLSLGLPKTLVAQEVGIARRTLYDWERLPEFQAELHVLLSEAETATRMKLRSLASVAVETLQQCMIADEVPWAVRFSAACKVLGLVMQENIAPLPAGQVTKRTIGSDVLQTIWTEVYGIHEDEPIRKGLSDESAASIRRKVLGIQDRPDSSR
jgi:hypothetical protein